MFEPVYEFPKQQRNAGKIFGISGLKVAFNFWLLDPNETDRLNVPDSLKLQVEK